MSCGFNLAAASAPPPQAPALGAVVPGEPVATLTALRADKSEVGSFPFSGSVTVGRDTGGIFAGDSYLSPRHATLNYRSGRFVIRDELSLNGTFVKLIPDQPVELKPSDIFRIGQEIIRFEALQPQPASPDGVERLGSPSKGYVGRLALIVGRDVTGNAFPVPESGVHLGRERGDILFPEDGYVSGLHCRIRAENGRVTLTDLGSSNGTFLRLTSEYEIRSGEEVLMGQQLFRLTFLSPSEPSMDRPAPPTIRVVAAVVERDGAYLITQRRPSAVLPLLWEFPGGRVEADETDSAALRREVKHRLGVDVEVGQLISFVSHPYEKYVVDLYLYECYLCEGEPTAQNVNAFQWASSAEFDRFSFTPADEASMTKLLGVG
jgi:mutator protein MutT